LDVDFALHLDPAVCTALFDALSRGVLGVLKTTAVDRDHLRRWAVELGAADLVEKALREVGVEPA